MYLRHSFSNRSVNLHNRAVKFFSSEIARSNDENSRTSKLLLPANIAVSISIGQARWTQIKNLTMNHGNNTDRYTSRTRYWGDRVRSDDFLLEDNMVKREEMVYEVRRLLQLPKDFQTMLQFLNNEDEKNYDTVHFPPFHCTIIK